MNLINVPLPAPVVLATLLFGGCGDLSGFVDDEDARLQDATGAAPDLGRLAPDLGRLDANNSAPDAVDQRDAERSDAQGPSSDSAGPPPDAPTVPGKLVTVRPADHGKAVPNPGMGWNFAYTTFSGQCIGCRSTKPKGDYLDWLPADIAYFRVTWASVQPQENVFNWNTEEMPVDEWVSRGKRVAFKWYTLFVDTKPQQATPLWVKDAGAKGLVMGTGGAWAAYYDDPVLLQKLGSFYAAAAARFDGEPWVEFIELGSLGRVGEGTVHQTGGLPMTLAMKKTHIDLLRRHFKKTQLIVNDDLGGDACTYAKTLGYGVDDHSIGVGQPSEDDRDSDDGSPGRSWNAEVLAPFWRSAPVGLESGTYHLVSNFYYDQMEASHASYMRVHNVPYNYQERMPIVERINRRMGYRLQFTEASWPENVTAGQPFELRLALRNGGVAPPYAAAFAAITVKDGNGRVVARASDAGLDVRSLQVGATAEDAPRVARTLSLVVPANTSAGDYTLWVSVGDPEGTANLALPYNQGDSAKRYPLGTLRVRTN